MLGSPLSRLILTSTLLVACAPGLAQTPCTDPQTIGCDDDPEYGWIERGSAPKKRTDEGPKSRTEELLKQAPTEQDKEEAERQRQAEQRQRINEMQGRQREMDSLLFEAKRKAVPEMLSKLSKTGSCPPNSGATPASDPRESYTLTRNMCMLLNLDACIALKDVCTGDAIQESSRGTCTFPGGPDSWGGINAQPRDKIVADMRQYEQKCEVGRDAEACGISAMYHSYSPIPGANPRKAYHYVSLACANGAQWQCEVKRDDCVPDGEPVTGYAQPPAPQQSASLVPPPRQMPAPSQTPAEPRGHCPFPRVTQATRDQWNAVPAEKRSKDLRDHEQGCLARRDYADCFAAAMDNATLTVPEANPDKSWRFMSLACEYDASQSQCETKKAVCVSN